MSGGHRPLFGLETEYGVAAFTADGPAVDARELSSQLHAEATRSLACAPAACGGLFLANGARFYIDAGHPEWATAEVAHPEAAVAQARAGDRAIEGLAETVAKSRGWRVIVLRGNVDYLSRTTFGRHDSYLHRVRPDLLHQQLLPHVVARVLFGAGGLNPASNGIELSSSPRSAFITTTSSATSTTDRPIIHTRDEPLCGHGYRRLHLICPGETLLSETGIYLSVATTALIIALVEGGERPGDPVRLESPVKALRRYAADLTCRNRAELARGGEISALEIERHYLECVERRLGSRILPEWAPDACRRWRSALEILERGFEGAAGVLDWPTKVVVYRDFMRRQGFDAPRLRTWNGVAKVVRRALGTNKEIDCDTLTASDSPIRAAIDGLTPILRDRGESWQGFRSFVDLRHQLLEIESRWGALNATGIWAGLDRDGQLCHRVLSSGSIDEAMRQPPVGSRAKFRGDLIKEARWNGNPSLSVSWDRVLDDMNDRMVDLTDPFATEAAWTPIRRTIDRLGRPWTELLARESWFAASCPDDHLQLLLLASRLEALGRTQVATLTARRVLAIVERHFAPDHPLVGECLSVLAARLPDESSRERRALTTCAEAIRELQRKRAAGEDGQTIALAYNEVGIGYRGTGKGACAELMFRNAYGIEDAMLPPEHPKRPHRLGNLASALLMQGELEESAELLERAWSLKEGAHDLTSARILCLRFAVESCAGRDGNSCLGRLKTLLDGRSLTTSANIATTWSADNVWDAIAGHLSPDPLALVRVLSHVLNDPMRRGELQAFRVWRDASPVDLSRRESAN